MKSFISFSGGVESSTMCVLFGNKADAIFADTGFEHKEMYERLPKVEEAVKKFHENNFTVHVVRNEEWGILQNYIREYKFYPNFQNRFCTGMFKIQPIDKFLMQFKDEGVEIMIGLNRDEAGQRTGNHGLLPFVNYTYPLIENNVSRDMCKQILKSANIYPQFPPFMKRGGCVGCYYKGKSEFKALLKLQPKEYDKVMELEEVIQDKREKFFAPTNVRQGLRKFKEEVFAQPDLFEAEEQYATINDVTKCGVFCNR